MATKISSMLVAAACAGLPSLIMAGAAEAAQPDLPCPVTYAKLKTALVQADNADSTGFNNHYWAVVVNRGGSVCAVAFSGADAGSQWPLSRQIAAAKAFTANGLSLNIGTPSGALSTAQLYRFVQPSNANVLNPLFGLSAGNDIDASSVYQGYYGDFGTDHDPLIGRRTGGTITFGGGLALYSGASVVGGLGLSGDTACADHSVAWRTRILLQLQQANPADKLPFATDAAATNGHPHCPNDVNTQGSTGGTVAAN